MNLVLDIATAALPNAADYLEEPSAPANYKDPVKIAAAIAEKKAALLSHAALDPDLARITAIGYDAGEPDGIAVSLCRNEAEERTALEHLAAELTGARIITYAGFRFDLPMLQRRALYLGVPFPKLNLDRFRSPHLDLCELLSGRERDRMRSLDFFCKRLGWDDLMPKPMDGEEEGRIFEHNRWADLERSVRRDVTAVRRLAAWVGELDEEEAPKDYYGSGECSCEMCRGQESPSEPSPAADSPEPGLGPAEGSGTA